MGSKGSARFLEHRIRDDPSPGGALDRQRHETSLPERSPLALGTQRGPAHVEYLAIIATNLVNLLVNFGLKIGFGERHRLDIIANHWDECVEDREAW